MAEIILATIALAGAAAALGWYARIYSHPIVTTIPVVTREPEPPRAYYSPRVMWSAEFPRGESHQCDICKEELPTTALRTPDGHWRCRKHKRG